MAKLLKSKVVSSLFGLGTWPSQELKKSSEFILAWEPDSSAVPAERKFSHNISHNALGIAKKHQRAVQVIQRIFNARESSCHAALDDHHRSRLVHIQNRHSINRTAGIRSRGRIRYVIRANNQSHVCLREISVDL